MIDAEHWLERYHRQMDAWIANDLQRPAGLGERVLEAMRYSANAGGKRLRPLLVLAAGRYVGVAEDRLRLPALAIEYIHTYSLIHDDLPAMDDDDWRRGRPTNHKMFGEAVAILAGDGLLNEAFAKMAELVDSTFAALHVLDALRRLAHASGIDGLIAGQAGDLAAEHHDVALDALEAVHASKTGALIQAACQLPAWLMGNESASARLERFAWHFGLAFQIVDDILNVVGDAAVMGKSTGTDAHLDKATYPKLVGLERSWEMARYHQDMARQALGEDVGERGLLLALLDRAVERKA